MGVDISTWRARIGLFVQPRKSFSHIRTLHIPKGLFSLSVRLFLFLALMTCGDIESNPGPPKTQTKTSTKQIKQTPVPNVSRRLSQSLPSTSLQDFVPSQHHENRNIHEGVMTRQRTISSYTTPPTPSAYHESLNSTSSSSHRITTDSIPTTFPRTPTAQMMSTTIQTAQIPPDDIDRQGQPGHYQQDGGDMFAFMRNMKADLDKQNERINSNISHLNQKMDSIVNSVNELKKENAELRSENASIHENLEHLRQKMDYMESQSRRNNLRFHGILGPSNENWNSCEAKIRSFITNKLDSPELAEVEIERAHRVKSRNKDKSPIVVKFSRYKDCVSILERAKEVLEAGDGYYIQQDYTDRVKTHRRELGKVMIKERDKGNYSAIQFDKLIINDSIYKYDEKTRSPELIGKRSFTRAARATAGREMPHSEAAHTRLDTSQSISHDVYTTD